MNTSRLATSMLIRTSRSSIPSSSRAIRVLPSSPAFVKKPPMTGPAQPRFYSQLDRPTKYYSFAEVQALIKNPSPNVVLIDAREPTELQNTGTIPGSLNIPVTSKPDSFFITPEEFEDRFGFERPVKDTEVVFYCRSGVRSKAAATLAKQAGWENVSEYSGSWTDWDKNGGEKASVK